jgi:phage baseplate assembly protein W
MATLKKLYSDIDPAFTRTPGKNDIALSFDELAVIRALRYLLLTNNYERPFQPNLGSGIRKMLFEPINPLTATQLKTEIRTTINNHEPRVNLQDVIVQEMVDNNAYNVILEFYVGNNSTPTELTLILERTR